MLIVNTRPGADPRVFEIYPGSPDCTTHPNGKGVLAIRRTNTGGAGYCAGPGRMSFDCSVAFEHYFPTNEPIAHLIMMLRGNDPAVDTGYYKGHGAYFGKVHETRPRGALESWSPSYSDGAPGGHFIPPLSRSPVLEPEAPGQRIPLYRITVQSLLSASGFKYFRYMIGEPNKVPLYDTGDVEDDNADVDMTSQCLMVGAHFEPLPRVDQSANRIRLIGSQVSWSADSTPLPDCRIATP
jgi:hypothetical protein